MESGYDSKDIALPYHLDTMTTGVLPPAALPQRIPYYERGARKTDRSKQGDLVTSQQMLLANIRHLKKEVDKTNRDITRTRHERLYAELGREETDQERDMPYGSRFYRPLVTGATRGEPAEEGATKAVETYRPRELYSPVKSPKMTPVALPEVHTQEKTTIKIQTLETLGFTQ